MPPVSQFELTASVVYAAYPLSRDCVSIDVEFPFPFGSCDFAAKADRLPRYQLIVETSHFAIPNRLQPREDCRFGEPSYTFG
jgi:hypothetical protein